MSKFVPVEHNDFSWKVNSGYNTESHGFYIFLPSGSTLLFNLTYVKISIVTVVKISVFSLIDNVPKLEFNNCSKFQLSDDLLTMTCDKLTIKCSLKDKVEVKLHSDIGAEGNFQFEFNTTGNKKLDPKTHVEDTVQYIFSSPGKVTGQLKVSGKDINFDGAIGYYLHSTYPGRFDGLYTQSKISIFDSPTHKLISVSHQPCSSQKETSSLIEQFYIYPQDNQLTCTVTGKFNLQDVYQDEKFQHELPKTIDISIPVVEDASTTWNLNVTHLRYQACIDALEQLPYLARKVISKILPSPSIYFHSKPATLKILSQTGSDTSTTEISGHFYYEHTQF